MYQCYKLCRWIVDQDQTPIKEETHRRSKVPRSQTGHPSRGGSRGNCQVYRSPFNDTLLSSLPISGRFKKKVSIVSAAIEYYSDYFPRFQRQRFHT
jgi:hypothetical protein